MKESLDRYVALGDSFTAGSACEPGEAWPKLLTEMLRPGNPGIELRNLASHGATSAEVAGQLPDALEFEPDLVTIVFGANDVLETTRPDAQAYAERLDMIVSELFEANPCTRIVTATSPESWAFLGLGPRTGARVRRGITALNAVTRAVALAHGVA
ncbi:MAG TPA: GDSL-type esterase/lipase family protein, partial [Solirubrobacterales bacterium]|nr:GDSL-type esterase/lipase family protein [Solirubrobacterales bacterium]